MNERTGYVFESNGKWYARITVADSGGRRRNVKRTAGTKAEAKQILSRLRKELKNGNAKAVDILKITFGDLCDYYEAHYAKAAKFENGQKVEGLRDLRRVRGFLGLYRRHFGRRKLAEITYDDLRAYRERRLKVPTPGGGRRAMASMNREMAYLRRIFNIAVRQGWIERNPFNCGEPLILVSCERKREKILTIEEEQRLLAACDEPRRRHLRPLLIALLDTGARKGEMLKLTWGDVDFQNGVISIQAMNTKTLRTRQLPITERLRRELEGLWERSDKRSDSLVFGVRGDVKRSFATACEEAGITKGGVDGLNIHSMRHTAATRLVQGQMPIELVGRILGHSQPQTTYRYISANRGVLEAARSIFEATSR